MIQSIEKIDRVGVLNGFTGSDHPFARLSLIYAVNGCGKSTLAAVLAAAGTGDTRSLNDRRSLETTGDPHVRLKVLDGRQRVLNKGSWAGDPVASHVFDAQFVDQNVHTGGEVTPAHRQGLLGIAIGKTAVEQQGKLETAQGLVTAAKGAVAGLETELVSMAHAIDPSTNLETFERIPVVEKSEADSRVAEAETALTAGHNLSRILDLPIPAEVSPVALDLDDFLEALGESLSTLHDAARRRVAEHIADLETGSSTSPETWLRAGVGLAHDGECPFCGQGTTGVELVDLYGEFFDTAYGDLRDRIDRLRERLGVSAREQLLERVRNEHERASAAAAAWATHVQVQTLSGLDEVATTFSEFGPIFDALIERKITRFEVPIEVKDDSTLLTDLADALPAAIEKINIGIRLARSVIGIYRQSITGSTLPQLEANLATARLEQLRSGAEAIRLFGERGTAKKAQSQIEKDATEARNASKKAMNDTLSQFEETINRYLGQMHAQFRIDKVTSTYAGGTGRGNYGLKLRGTSIDVSSGTPPFQLALSEGDKRTLAFAFFCATVLRGEDLRGHVVVVDDPVTSLDKHRRRHTTDQLNEMSLRGAQIIVLAHDATYLRDVRESFRRKEHDSHGSPRTSTELQLMRSISGDSLLAKHDLDRECESKFFRHYRQVSAYVNFEQQDGALISHTVAGEAIRPLIESYLHRRFPGRVPNETLGSVVSTIASVSSNDVLSYAKPIAGELAEINRWAMDYHHDTNSDFAGQEPDPDEVRAFGIRALKVVHGDPDLLS